MSTKIGIIIRSFGNPFREKYPFMGLAPGTSRVNLPDSRVLYTVLRSPHIDKKSREQFQMIVKKQYIVMKTDPRDLEKKFFWLKRQRILGAQYEVRLHCKTRLDPNMLQKLVSSSTSSA
ncbi:Ribosomal protein S10 [Carex littledalei]|uniref:Ribosomal protein S10 n=1 Tax=Carex littledalei TaxID=544730 RepID=A0A833QQE3_9POAL|nr:Ribosomal protein S10 [Carex littledalei]